MPPLNAEGFKGEAAERDALGGREDGLRGAERCLPPALEEAGESPSSTAGGPPSPEGEGKVVDPPLAPP